MTKKDKGGINNFGILMKKLTELIGEKREGLVVEEEEDFFFWFCFSQYAYFLNDL